MKKFATALLVTGSVLAYGATAHAAPVTFADGPDITVTLGGGGTAGSEALLPASAQPLAVGSNANPGNAPTGVNTSYVSPVIGLKNSLGTLQLTDAQVVKQSADSYFAAPYSFKSAAQIAHPYISVYNGGTATFSLAQNSNSFSLLWGSVDPSNSVTLEEVVGNTTTVVGTVSGSDLLGNKLGLDSGSWGSDGSVFANLKSSVAFNTVVLGSGQNSFEFSDARVSSVPLPAALPLFGAALAGLGGLGLKRKKAEKVA
jgi:hypothetical protein